MTAANDSIVVTPGSGATVGAHLVNSKEHEVWSISDTPGQLRPSPAGYYAYTLTSVRITTSTAPELVLYNNDASLIVDVEQVRVCKIVNAVDISLVAGGGELVRVSTYSGGTTVAPVKLDTNTATLDTEINLIIEPNSIGKDGETISRRMLPTGGGTEYTQDTAMVIFSRNQDGLPIVLRQGQGICVNGWAPTIAANEQINCFLSFSIIFKVRE